MTRFEVQFEIPMKLPSLPNLRKMPLAKAKTVAHIRETIGGSLLVHARPFREQWYVLRGNPKLGLRVTFVRVSPGHLDDDNNVGAFKPVRDELARFFRMDDRSSRYEWHYAQAQGLFAVRIAIEVQEREHFEVPLPPIRSTTSRKKFNPTPNVRKPQ